eukprot:IDg3662t1
MYRLKPVSGETEEDISVNVMQLYRRRCKTTDKFEWSATDRHSNLSTDLAGPPATATGVRSIPDSSPSTARSIRIKEAKRKQCPQRAEFGLSAIETAIFSSAERKEQVKEAPLRF